MATKNRNYSLCLRPVFVFLLGAIVLFSGTARASYILSNVVDTGDPNFNQELAINNSGVIAGYFGDGTVLPNKGYTVVSPYGSSNFINENFPGSVQTQVTGINSNGDTVGFWIDGSGANHGFTDISGVFTSLNDPASTATPTFTQILGVNNSDEVAGFFMDAAGASHAFTWAGGIFTPIVLANSTSSTATDVNNSGEVSGFETSTNGDTYGFLNNTLYLYPGSTFTQFLGLNNQGLVVGDYMDAAGNTNGLVYNTLTGVWQTVDDPFAVGGAGNGTTINGINDEGQIVGFYVNAAGQTIGLIGTAVPEPGTLSLLLLSGALAIGMVFLKR